MSSALWNPQAHMPTAQAKRLTIVAGEGAWLTTDTGQRLLDATAGLWHANIGHGDEQIANAAQEQMKRLETYHVFGRFANEPALRLAQRLSDLVPIESAKIFLTSGGSDSIEVVCKLARRHWQLEGRPEKRIIVSRDLAYHGLHGFGTSIAGLGYNRDGYGSESLVPETARIASHDLDQAIDTMQSLGTSNIAAIIAEPVIGTGGVHGPRPGYLEGLRDFARANDILVVADEVITGFGRAGYMFASQRWQLKPDMIAMAKGLTSGYAPLGAVAIAPRIADRFFNSPDAPIFRHGLTYTGHATSCVVAEQNLDILQQKCLVERAANMEADLARAVAPLGLHPLVAETRAGSGFLAGIALKHEVDGDSVAERCVDAGVVTRVIHGNTLQISPPFVVSRDEVDLIASTIAGALDQEAEAMGAVASSTAARVE